MFDYLMRALLGEPEPEEPMLPDDLHIAGITKCEDGDERYLILFHTSQFNEVRRVLGRWASNPDLSFTWGDAAAVNAQLRRDEAECQGK